MQESSATYAACAEWLLLVSIGVSFASLLDRQLSLLVAQLRVRTMHSTQAYSYSYSSGTQHTVTVYAVIVCALHWNSRASPERFDSLDSGHTHFSSAIYSKRHCRCNLITDQ